MEFEEKGEKFGDFGLLNENLLDLKIVRVLVHSSFRLSKFT